MFFFKKKIIYIIHLNFPFNNYFIKNIKFKITTLYKSLLIIELLKNLLYLYKINVKKSMMNKFSIITTKN